MRVQCAARCADAASRLDRRRAAHEEVKLTRLRNEVRFVIRRANPNFSGVRLRLPLVLLLWAGASASQAAANASSSAPRPVSFNRDIRPIMSDTCFHCHGFDASSRKAGLRLDIREEALKPTKNGVIPIVPGKPDQSEIILRISDDVDPMPPADAHKTLTREQKELFRRWVAEGAVYEPHWSYAALTRPALPSSAPAARGSTSEGSRAAPNPIDAFVRAKLAERNITPSPEATAARLVRRMSLDLTGLPPAPEEVARFEAEHRRDPNAAVRSLADRLFASPHHGERIAVWWLDIARYADTVGFHGDQNQRVFPYRDYVINAFNANKRFDQFTIEQLAGDLLPNPTLEQRVATGYNRLNMMTREGGAQPKEYLAKYGAERVRSVAAAWFGSTFGCAECHDHKFDPIKSRDFYELQAFFADVKQWGVYHDYQYTPNPELAGFSNDHPFPPEIEVESPYLLARRQRLEAELAAERKGTAALVAQPENAAKVRAWAESMRAFLTAHPSGWVTAKSVPELIRANKPLAEAKVSATDDGTVTIEQALRRGDNIRFKLQPTTPVASLRVEFLGLPPADAKKEAGRHVVRLAAAVRDAAGKDRKLTFVHAEASAKETRYENGFDVLGIVTGWKLPREAALPLVGVWTLPEPLTLQAGEHLVVTLTTDTLPPFRISTSPFAALEPLAVASDALRAAVLATPEHHTAEQSATLAEAWLASTAANRERLQKQHALAARIRETRGGRTMTMVSEPAAPLTVRVLPRGNWLDESGPVVLPATPSFLPARAESTEEKRLTRLDLARYIVSAENPITARTVVNRLWSLFFGTGLSAVIDDLGSQGEAPSHPELLDWLACELRDSGWDLRHIMRLIVTSATYRQSSSLRPELRDVDPANRLLASQNPRRLEAEFVRDNALFIAGALNLRDLGGPSVKPYQPAGYYAALQFPDRDYDASTDDEQWRRGVYMHWQRTFLHPMLANFDAPARDECAAQRVVSNTPQQALTLLNDPTFVEAARLLAARLVREETSDDARLRQAYLLAVARPPRDSELASLRQFLARQREHYRANAADAEKLLRIGLAPQSAGDTSELAAWTSVARVVLNAHETVTRY
jgi:hypothetical protein